MSEAPSGLGQLLSSEWMSNTDYLFAKSEFAKTHAPLISKQLPSIYNPNELSPPEVTEGATLLSLFSFGVKMVYRRLDGKYSKYGFEFTVGLHPDDPVLGYRYGNDKFCVDSNWFKHILKMMAAGTSSIEIPTYAIHRPIAISDLFELAGVEEAAHRIFYLEKQYPGKPGIADGDPRISYNSSEFERRANLWKLAYTKRYMPDYYPALQQTTQQVNVIMREIGQQR
jgi:hypothetical protein